MKRILFLISLGLFFFFNVPGYAGGGMTHMFLAQELISQIPDSQLRNLIQNNLEAYLVGAYYPDSGYVGGNHYGEDSHWDPFIYAFANYLKEKYPNPTITHPKLVAFLLGCATHRLSDEIMHGIFYPLISKNDFHRVWDWDPTIHEYGDLGIDLLLNVDKNQWFTHTVTWWVPVNDLVQVYRRMGKEQYTHKEIIWGNILIFYAGYGERLISAPAYPYLKRKIPWTSQHYYDWEEGGLISDEKKVITYLMSLWSHLNSKQPINIVAKIPKTYIEHETVAVEFARIALEKKYVEVPVTNNPDGSIELQPPVIKSYIQYQLLLNELFNKVIR